MSKREGRGKMKGATECLRQKGFIHKLAQVDKGPCL